MKYQVGDLVKWDDDVIDFDSRKNEHYMIITNYERKPSTKYCGIYTYRYIDTGREDRYIDTLLEPSTSKVG